MVEAAGSIELISPFNIIFSCVVCQKTIDDLYPHPNTAASPDKSTQACKLWLSKCAHLICNNHVQLTIENSRPTSICPLCLKEKNDHEPKTLFGIYGPQPNNYDKSIPSMWFDIPPIEMSRGSPEMSALRFQYVSMLRYGVMMHKRYSLLNSSFVTLKEEVSKSQADLRVSELECFRLREQLEEFKKLKAKHEAWKEQEPKIKACLQSFSQLTKENNALKTRLEILETQTSGMPGQTELQDDIDALFPASPPLTRGFDGGEGNLPNTTKRKLGYLERENQESQLDDFRASVITPSLSISRFRYSPKVSNQSFSSNTGTGTSIHFRPSMHLRPTNVGGQSMLRTNNQHMPTFDVGEPMMSGGLRNTVGVEQSLAPQTPQFRSYRSESMFKPQSYKIPQILRQQDDVHFSSPLPPVPLFQPSIVQTPRRTPNDSAYWTPKQVLESHKRASGSRFLPIYTPRKTVPPVDQSAPRMESNERNAHYNPNLNSLSFIHDPYTFENKPVDLSYRHRGENKSRYESHHFMEQLPAPRFNSEYQQAATRSQYFDSDPPNVQHNYPHGFDPQNHKFTPRRQKNSNLRSKARLGPLTGRSKTSMSLSQGRKKLFRRQF